MVRAAMQGRVATLPPQVGSIQELVQALNTDLEVRNTPESN